MLDEYKDINRMSEELDGKMDILKIKIEEKQKEYRDNVSIISKMVQITEGLDEDEKNACCGSYEGAYSWVLENVRATELLPTKGKLNLWNFECDVLNKKGKKMNDEFLYCLFG